MKRCEMEMYRDALKVIIDNKSITATHFANKANLAFYATQILLQNLLKSEMIYVTRKITARKTHEIIEHHKTYSITEFGCEYYAELFKVLDDFNKTKEEFKWKRLHERKSYDTKNLRTKNNKSITKPNKNLPQEPRTQHNPQTL